MEAMEVQEENQEVWDAVDRVIKIGIILGRLTRDPGQHEEGMYKDFMATYGIPLDPGVQETPIDGPLEDSEVPGL